MEREMEAKRLEREMEGKRLKREPEAKLLSEKPATQLDLERLQLERARVERKNMEARAKVQSAASSQAGQENVVAVIEIPELPGFVDGNNILDLSIYCSLKNMLPLQVGSEIHGLFGLALANCFPVKHWMFILNL